MQFLLDSKHLDSTSRALLLGTIIRHDPMDMDGEKTFTMEQTVTMMLKSPKNDRKHIKNKVTPE